MSMEKLVKWVALIMIFPVVFSVFAVMKGMAWYEGAMFGLGFDALCFAFCLFLYWVDEVLN